LKQNTLKRIDMYQERVKQLEGKMRY